MFDKKAYDNQREIRKDPDHVKIPNPNRRPVESEPGHNMVRMNGQMIVVNRKIARNRSPIRNTKKGFKGHVVRESFKPRWDWPNDMTNHERMKIRAEHRQQEYLKKKGLKEGQPR